MDLNNINTHKSTDGKYIQLEELEDHGSSQPIIRKINRTNYNLISLEKEISLSEQSIKNKEIDWMSNN
jgi:hypothetical protein